MRVALLLIVIVGVAIGIWMPAPREAAPAAVGPAPAAVERDGPRRETRIERARNSHFYAEAQVNGQPVDFVIDTGASSVVLTIDDARRLGIPFDQRSFTVVGHGASGPARGEIVNLASVALDGKRVYDVEGVVLEGLQQSLLGQSYLRHVSIEVRGDAMRLY